MIQVGINHSSFVLCSEKRILADIEGTSSPFRDVQMCPGGMGCKKNRLWRRRRMSPQDNFCILFLPCDFDTYRLDTAHILLGLKDRRNVCPQQSQSCLCSSYDYCCCIVQNGAIELGPGWTKGTKTWVVLVRPRRYISLTCTKIGERVRKKKEERERNM